MPRTTEFKPILTLHSVSGWAFTAFFVVALLGSGPVASASDSGATVFMGAKSDVGWGITATQDGGYLVVGGTDSVGAGKEDGLILKLDTQRHIQWSLVLGGPIDDEFEQAVQTPDGGYAVCGGSYSFNHVDSRGWATPWVVRFNSAGQILWQKYYVRPAAAWVWRIINTRDGGFALCGVSWTLNATGMPIQHPFLMKLTAVGDAEWQTSFGPDVGRLQGICQLPDGGFAATGCLYTPETSHLFVAVLRLDPGGNLSWRKTFDIPNDYDSSESPCAIIATQDGGVLFGGGNPGQIRKLDQDGDTLWNWRADIPPVHGDWATIHTLIAMEDGGYCAAGYFGHLGVYSSEDFYGAQLVRLSADGSIQWAKAYGSTWDLLESTMATTSHDGGIALTGVRPSHVDQANTVFLITDPDGLVMDSCITTRDIQSVWTTAPSESSRDLQIPLIAVCDASSLPVASTTVTLDSENSFCPVIRNITILQNPLRLDIRGFSLWPYVFVDGHQVVGKWVSSGRVIGKGSATLKGLMPKGQPVCVQVGVPGGLPYMSDCYMKVRH